MWGMDQPTLEANLNLIKNAGFDGTEMQVPAGKQEQGKLKGLLNETNLDLIAQVRAEGKTADEQIDSFKKELDKTLPFNPLLVNAHCGKDYWPLSENLKVIAAAQTFADKVGIKITHETHRARATFCAPTTMDIIGALPGIRFTADFSHWCCVHNTLLEDQPKSVNRLIEKTDYIHARVGSAVTPQVTDPRAPEWRAEVETHVQWWEKIAKLRKAGNTDVLPICSEFGPPNYMATIPYTREPVANLWEINCYMKDMLSDKLKGCA